MLSEIPELAAQWHLARNGSLSPAQVPAQSNKKAWWQCEKLHEWDATVSNRTLGRGCPYCANKRVGYGNDLASVHPEIAAEWHRELNGEFTPNQVVPGSGAMAWWQCPRNADHCYQATVNRRVGQRTRCPYCANRKTGYGNDLASLHPEIAAEWHRELNGRATPGNVVPGSPKSAWWRCPQGHNYQAPVHKRVTGAGCPVCSGRRTPHVTHRDLSSERPDIAALWHASRNGTLTPRDVTSQSNRLLWWICPQQHEFDAQVNALVKVKTACPYCSGHRVGYGNDLATLFPKITAELHPVRNDGFDPHVARPYTHVKAWWRCGECEYEWEATVASRTHSGRGCSKCGTQKSAAARRRPAEGKSLSDQFPDTAAEWHPYLNGDSHPAQFKRGSKTIAWWRCRNDSEHEWRATISIRTRAKDPSGCPYCAGQRATGQNNLAVRKPELVLQWDSDRNGELTPDQVAPNSHLSAWWICSANPDHSWEAVIASRAGGRGCPYCANQKVGHGNDLAAAFPDVAAEWHPTRNGTLTPDQVAPKTDRKVWWQCARGHEWHTTVDSRTGRGTGCSECYLMATSKIEIRVFAELAHVLAGQASPIEHTPYILVPSWRKVSVDMRFGNVIVEYDGAYWHEGREASDTAKVARLAAAGFRVVRIRELPLDVTGNTDVRVPKSHPSHLIAGAVLSVLAERAWITDTAKARAAAYIAVGATQATAVAATLIAERGGKPKSLGGQTVGFGDPILGLPAQPDPSQSRQV
jgi:Probable Zinc-ribbon domain